MKQIKFLSLSIFISFFSIALLANNHSPAPASIVKQYFLEVDAGKFTEVEKLLADNLQATAPFSPQVMPKQAWLSVLQGFKAAFPNMQHEILSYVESDFSVAVRGIFKGKNDGPMMGNPATGNFVAVPFNTIVTFDASWKLQAIHVQFDQKAFEAQLMAGLPNPAVKAELDILAMLSASDEGNGEKFMSYWVENAPNYFAGKQTSGEDMKKRIIGFKTGFPDIKRNIENVIVSGNYVTVRGYVTGTNTGLFRGQAPTGNAIRVPWLGLYQLNASGKIERGWVEFDTATLDHQLRGELTAKGK